MILDSELGGAGRCELISRKRPAQGSWLPSQPASSRPPAAAKIAPTAWTWSPGLPNVCCREALLASPVPYSWWCLGQETLLPNRSSATSRHRPSRCVGLLAVEKLGPLDGKISAYLPRPSHLECAISKHHHQSSRDPSGLPCRQPVCRQSRADGPACFRTIRLRRFPANVLVVIFARTGSGGSKTILSHFEGRQRWHLFSRRPNDRRSSLDYTDCNCSTRRPESSLRGGDRGYAGRVHQKLVDLQSSNEARRPGHVAL